MSNSYLFSETYNFLDKALNVSTRRHNLISSNIANMDTIGYKPRDLDFNKTLLKAIDSEKGAGDMVRTDSKHYQGTRRFDINNEATICEDAYKYRLDSVNIDTEMTNLMESSIKNRITSELMIRKIKKLKEVITSGG